MKDPQGIVEVTCPQCGKRRNVTRMRAREIGYQKATCHSCANLRREAHPGHYKQPDPVARSLFRTRIYRVWSNMKTRCGNPNTPSYHWYGARGITVCDRWLLFANFVEDMYPTYAAGLTLERIDNNAGYSPENCRWSTMMEQGGNKRNNVLITYNGETATTAEWSRRTGIVRTVLAQRLRAGWTPEAIMTTSVRVTRRSSDPTAARLSRG